MEYDQRVIIRFLWNEGISADEITTRLQAQFGEASYKIRTVRFWIAEVRRGRADLHDEIRSGRPPLDDIDAKILGILDKSPFESARSIADSLGVTHVTVLNHLHLSIGFKSYHLRWVPHLLTEDLRQKRKEGARAMLRLLLAAQRDGWHHLVTGDESWFFFDTSPRRMWTLSRDEVATKPRQQIQSKKFMFTIIWNPNGFHVIDSLPNGTKMNSDYFVTNILTPLEEAIFPQGRALHQKRLMIHLDNCSVHTSRVSTEWLDEHDMLRMPQPPYSPDLAPSDFYLFPTVKEKLERTQMADEDQFFESLEAILRGIDQEELNRVFQAWVERVRKVSEGNGDYV